MKVSETPGKETVRTIIKGDLVITTQHLELKRKIVLAFELEVRRPYFTRCRITKNRLLKS